jgi:membrane-associated PAP2 superfamily phosphatase
MTPATRPSNTLPLRLGWAWLAVALCTLGWDASGLDLTVMRLIGAPGGFPWQHHPLLERVLHNGFRQLAWVAFGLLAIWAARRDPPSGATTAPARRERLVVLGLVTLAVLTINAIKWNSRTSCPWDWAEFGGPVPYVSHWDLFTVDGGAGRCFPGGHASSALAFVAMGLPWLWPPSGTRRPAIGMGWLAAALLAGLVAGGAQTLRGAHPPSHTLWTALICSGVALAGWQLAMPWLRAGRVQRPVKP